MEIFILYIYNLIWVCDFTVGGGEKEATHPCDCSDAIDQTIPVDGNLGQIGTSLRKGIQWTVACQEVSKVT